MTDVLHVVAAVVMFGIFLLSGGIISFGLFQLVMIIMSNVERLWKGNTFRNLRWDRPENI